MPPTIQAIADTSIDALWRGQDLPDDATILARWIEEEQWDLVVAPAAMTVRLPSVGVHFCDKSVRDKLGLTNTARLTKAHRVEFARQAIQNAIENNDGVEAPSISSYPLRHTDGRTAVYGCVIEIHGQRGPSTNWLGVYENEDAFIADLLEAGTVPVDNLEALADADILKFWPK